jgi:ribose 1,5-bisphosphate isomerase
LEKEVERICSDIKRLKIQGARNVARAAMKAMAIQASKSKASDRDGLMNELLVVADSLASTRPTEPMLRNTLAMLFSEIGKNRGNDAGKIREMVVRIKDNFLEKMESNELKVAEFGAKEIPEGSTILTHCHSSTVTAILKRANELNKKIEVICSESRPMFQGLITVKELSKAGIKVTLIVDSAVKHFIKDVDLVLVGADAITSAGDLINKIGTSMIATVAYESGVRMYSAAETYKFDPLTLWGRIEKIEERHPDEVADPKKLKGVIIRNPAFDVTQAKYLTAYITEIGVVPPQGLVNLLWKEFNLGEG